MWRRLASETRFFLCFILVHLINFVGYTFLRFFHPKYKDLRKFRNVTTFTVLNHFIKECVERWKTGTWVWSPQIISSSNVLGRILQGMGSFDRTFVMWVGARPFILTAEARTVERILPISVERPYFYDPLHKLIGNGLPWSKECIWRPDRKGLSPCFKKQRFESFLSCFNKNSQILVDIFRGFGGQPTNVRHFVARATMDMAVESLLGGSENYQINWRNDVIDDYDDLFNHCSHIYRSLLISCGHNMPGLFSLAGTKHVDGTPYLVEIFPKVNTWIEQRSKLHETGGIKEELYIDAVLNLPARSDKDKAAHIFTIFIGAMESTTNAVNSALFLLALHPEIQHKVHEEIDSVLLGREGGNGTEMTLSDIKKLEFMERVLKESMRVYSPAPGLFREISQDIELEDGRIVPKGVEVAFLLWELHRDPSIFPDPERFDPDRFLPENCQQRNTVAFIPFGAGQRNCLGWKYAMLQMKVVLTHILRNFTVSTNQRRQDVTFFIGMSQSSTPILTKLNPRSRTSPS